MKRGVGIGHRCPCPNCGEVLRIYSSRQVTGIYREVYFICSNLDCLCKVKGSLTLEAVISKPLMVSPRADNALGSMNVREPPAPAPG